MIEQIKCVMTHLKSGEVQSRVAPYDEVVSLLLDLAGDATPAFLMNNALSGGRSYTYKARWYNLEFSVFEGVENV